MSDYEGWEVDYEKAKSADHTAADVLKKTEGRRALEKAIRDLVNQYLRYNHAITDEDRRAAGLPLPDDHPTPHPKPATWPELDFVPEGPGVFQAAFRDKGSQRRGKPAGAHGIELRWAILDTPPVDADQILHSVFATRSPYTFTFEGHDRGKTVYVIGRWENSKGDEGKGPWTEIYNTI
ncbi:MAG: hypothetical protein LBS97_03495, partial [Treponema sp.]|nr:hypothetical protein [Treponema sp.]